MEKKIVHIDSRGKWYLDEFGRWQLDSKEISVLDNKEETYSKKDMTNAYIQGVKDYCRSSKSLDAFLGEEVHKWVKENLNK
jgi:hypothetical protein